MQTITACDIETGGLEYSENPITEIALVTFDLETFRILEEYKTFVKPYADLVVTKDALQRSMVTTKDIQNGIEAKVLVKDLISYFKRQNTSNGKVFGRTRLLGHNFISFDIEFIEYLFLLHEKNLYDFVSKKKSDTLIMSEDYWAGQKVKHNLSEICERIGYNLSGAHGAMSDTKATVAIFKYLIQKMRNSSSSVEVEEKKENQQRKYFNF